MSTQPSEKVGVVVIHGVGETYEGWIDAHLVPELERWAAYDSVAANKRKDKDNGLLLSIRAADRHIAIALGDDADFAKFCHLAGLDALAADPNYQTRAERLKNRDALRRHIGPVLAQKPANTWLSAIKAAGVPATMAFNPESQVNRVRDPESSDTTRTWQSFTRRLPLDGREVLVTELFWADMSRIGDSSLSKSYALIQLFLESPWILGRAFLKGSERGIHAVIRWLIVASNWLLRWPIAGLNVAVFVTAFAAMALLELGGVQWLLPAIAVSLAVVAVAGFKFFRTWVHRKIGLADMALAASIHALLLLALLGLAVMFAAPATLNSPAPYLAVSVLLILIAWIAWTLLNVLAILLVSLVALKRIFLKRRAGDPPLARPAAAISLGVLLGMLWKFMLALLGVMVIAVLVPASGSIGSACPAAPLDLSKQLSPVCLLAFAKEMLIEVSSLNTIALFLVLLAIGGLVATRSAAKAAFRKKAEAGTLRLPRLIAHPLIVMTLFAGALINATVFFIIRIGDFGLSQKLYDLLPHSGFETAGSAIIGMTIFFFLIRRVVEWSGSIIHIGRDLVDHQYDPDPNAYLMRMVPEAGGGEPRRFRRRQRIQKRLEALIDEVIADQRCDRLIFLAHSQGTVILHDYLMDHDHLVGQTHAAGEALFDVKRIDIITMGSPLTHIYRHYFLDYDRPPPPEPGKPTLIDRVDSWTNMWRVDDPIGQNIGLPSHVIKIDNVGLRPGGHTYYWREDKVCEKVWSLIQGAPGAKAASAKPAADAAASVT